MSQFNAVCASTRAAYQALLEKGLECVMGARDACIAKLLRQAFSQYLRPHADELTYQQIRQSLGFDVPLLRGPELGELRDASGLSAVHGFPRDPLVIGWVYQIWNEPLREDSAWAVSYRDLKQSEDVQVGVVTQLFTDDYIADFLVRRCFDLQRRARPDTSVTQLSLCDPACGVGHILVQALRVMAEYNTMDLKPFDELSLYGFDIDPHAVELCRTLLLLESLRLGFRHSIERFWEHLQKAISVVNAPYGTLDRGGDNPTLRKKFDIVVANPPYLGRRKLPTTLRAYLDREYPAANIDLCAAFMQRCVELTADKGSIGFVTVDKWLRLRGYQSLRCGHEAFGGLLEELAFDSVCDLGERAFNRNISLHDGVRVALLCASKQKPLVDHEFAFHNATGLRAYTEKVESVSAFLAALQSKTWKSTVQQKDLKKEDNSQAFLRVSGLPLTLINSPRAVRDGATIVVGTQTNDDRRYVRYVWQIHPDRSRWRIHSKGGGYGRWCGLNRWVIDWASGAPHFFRSRESRENAERWNDRSGWSYTWFANGSLGLRIKEPGWSFGRAAASGVFNLEPGLVGFLNSRFASACARSIGGKIQLPEGVVKRIPVPLDPHPSIGALVNAAVALRRELARHDLTDALYDPLNGLSAGELLALEALLLLVEGSIEFHVETSLKITKKASLSFADQFGAPVAWRASICGANSPQFWSLVPSAFHHIKALLIDDAEYKGRSLGQAQAINAQIVSEAFSGRLRYDRARWLLPADGSLEEVCRALLIHPMDAVVFAQEEAKKNIELREHLEREWVRRKVVSIVLRSLDHRWWSKDYLGARQVIGPISMEDLRKMILDAVDENHLQLCCEGSFSEWLNVGFEKWQQKLFFGASPISVVKEVPKSTLFLQHIWDSEPTMMGRDENTLATR